MSYVLQYWTSMYVFFFSTTIILYTLPLYYCVDSKLCIINIIMSVMNNMNISNIHYTNLTFVCLSVRAGGHGKPFDPS